MDEKICSGGSVVDTRQRAGASTVGKTSPRRRPAVARPSPRAIQAVFQLIDEAETASSTWARNALMVFGVTVVLVLLAARMAVNVR